ncbi:YveK family protein [Bacillus cereus]|uniref:Polysaccharide chain length determinant N-terminal domain-containing protein n=1 Tax=Bacillus cereus VD184 TaxID=1053242 RepID=A0A9W5VS84_BACCE|nr:Wzz/FepE/Etk N-terminal domain-containing protein [Bacillus cereus]EOQ11109.1 hypothetical protein IKC_05708 [Bacillus cereus VD184]
MERTIDIKDLFKVVKKRFILIMTITLGCTLMGVAVNFYLITPIYESSAQILVNQKNTNENNIQLTELQTNIQLTNTYKTIIKSPVILERVHQKLSLQMSTQTLSNKISIENEKSSQIISIKVQDKNAVLASDIANTVAVVFKDEIPSIMNIDNVTILANAENSAGQKPIKPKPLFNTLLTCMGGLFISILMAFGLSYLDNTVKKEEDIEKILELPVIGIVSPMKKI